MQKIQKLGSYLFETHGTRKHKCEQTYKTSSIAPWFHANSEEVRTTERLICVSLGSIMEPLALLYYYYYYYYHHHSHHHHHHHQHHHHHHYL